MARRTLYTEPFTHADEAPLSLGGLWETHSVGNLGISSNICYVASTATQAWQTSVQVLPNDQWCQVDLPHFVSAASAPEIMLRCAVPNTVSGYLLVAGGFASNMTIYKMVTGTATSLVVGSAAVVQGDIILFEAIGTTLNGYINGVLKATIVDATFTSGRAGIGGFVSLNTDIQYDNFLSGDFTSSFQPALARRSNILIGAGRGM